MKSNFLLGLAVPLLVGALLTACQQPPGEADQSEQQAATFLRENAAKPGVISTASGLQYQVLQEGQGAIPGPTDTVTVNYRGSLIDGTEFDSGDAVSFPLNRVIPGWTEGLQLMKEGARYRFFIPSALAYGAQGAGRVIPPNAVLIFEVELLKGGEP